ncbi:hypothetical protein T281_06900 [Rhodomicrobium udaipurense JA643]|uniref:Antitoxin-like ribbon-helix-helix domain-containing protein n=1 Tax=Rhodomicrobium udaipurense TaxID=1202716 RepID=A0A8I1GCG9_9HYPH|nr:ribbon-helix-helix domain-containing protein [Rhodomicrobium udaipurense]KAI95191.1 hypothetical protein T281_06900 [Rhodomicrobium udaipurense JA643]MBJ7541958.1 hypothetical protein [Rhodomicrobium udaipurense]
MSTEPRVNKLKAAMQGMAGPTLPPTVTIPKEAEVRAVEARKTPLAPSRHGKRVVSAYVDATAAKQLRVLAASHETTTQALLEEALNDLFRKYDRSAIA